MTTVAHMDNQKHLSSRVFFSLTVDEMFYDHNLVVQLPFEAFPRSSF